MKTGVDYVGVACIFYCHDGKGNFLLHKRSQNTRDEKGRWDCGGGRLEVGESFEQAIRREVQEEYGVASQELKFVGVDNVIRDNEGERTHWVAVVFAVSVDPKMVKNGEPEKIEEIGWFRKGEFPTPKHSKLDAHFELVVKAGIFTG